MSYDGKIEPMTRVQALVIGGGVAGSAVACQLARAGKQIVLVERRIEPHDKVCGEFVSAEAAFYLSQLGVRPQSFGAVKIAHLNLYSSDAAASTELPFPALSVSRRLLDETLITTAIEAGAEVRRGHAVRSLQRQGDQWVAELDNDSRIAVDDVFLATGKHDLRGWKRPPGVQNDLIGFKVHFRLAPAQVSALTSLVELFLFPGGYAGLSLIENGIANLCLVVQRDRFDELDNRWDLLLSSLRAESLPLYAALAGAQPCTFRPLAIAAIPYGFVRRTGNGLWCLGDQAAVIPSFSGDGISIALHSACLASRSYLSGKTSAQFQSDLARDVSRQVRMATNLSRLLVQPMGRTIAMAVGQLLPGLLRQIARSTRIPGHRLIHEDANTKSKSTVR